MNFLTSLKDSVETSVTLDFFETKEDSSYSHVFESEMVTLHMKDIKKLDNFNPKRLSKNPYPEKDRPRGEKDLESLEYHQSQIKLFGHTDPIWVIKEKDKLTLLDGAHRIVSTYLQGKTSIRAYVIEI